MWDWALSFETSTLLSENSRLTRIHRPCNRSLVISVQPRTFLWLTLYYVVDLTPFGGTQRTLRVEVFSYFLITVKLGDNVLIRNKLVLRNHFPWPNASLLHKDKEHLALRNNFRVTKCSLSQSSTVLEKKIFKIFYFIIFRVYSITKIDYWRSDVWPFIW